MATERERILAQAGEPLALSEVRSEQAQETAQTLKYSPEVFLNFGREIMNLLAESQKLGTAPFVEKELETRERMAEEVMKPAEPGMPPSLQATIRRAEVGALEPILRGTQERRQTFAEQLRGFGTALEQARALGTSLMSLEQQALRNQLAIKQEARKTIEDMYKLGGKQAFAHLDDKEKRKWETLAGLPKGFIDALPEVETEEWTAPYTLPTGELVQKNKLTGEIKILSKPTPTGVALRPLPASQVAMLSDAKFIPSLLDKLEDTIINNADLFGPKLGILRRLKDRTRAQKIEAQIRMVAQLVGKFMEGGVLKKEDEEKYRKMLPNFGDWNSDVALSKLQGVRDMLEMKYQQYLRDFENAGYDVSGIKGLSFGGQTQVIRLKDPTTGEVREFEGLTIDDIKEAIDQGYQIVR